MTEIIFDLETIPDVERCKRLGYIGELNITPDEQLPEPEQVTKLTAAEVKKMFAEVNPRKEWLEQAMELERQAKDRKTVMETLESVAEGNMAWVKECSICPEKCKIVAMGWQIEGDEPQVICSDEFVDREELILKTFWNFSLNGMLVGYNILKFDLPVIKTRSAMLDIGGTRFIDSGRYSRSVIDIFQKRFDGWPQSGQPASLKELASLYDLDVPDDGDGSKVWQWYEQNQFDQIAKYQLSDVEVTYQLHRMWKGLFY